MSLPKKMKDHAVRHAEATEPHPAAAAKQAAQGKLLARERIDSGKAKLMVWRLMQASWSA